MHRLNLLPHQRRPLLAGVLAGLASVLVTAAPVAAASSVAVSPTTVRAGSSVVISGTIPTNGPQSCPASDAVTVTSTAALFPPDGFGPQASRTASGAFRVSYRVPNSTPPGTYTVGLRCGGGNVGVQASLRVTAQVTHVPSGAPGAGLGGASTESVPAAWIIAGTVAGVLACVLGVAAWRRRRI